MTVVGSVPLLEEDPLTSASDALYVRRAAGAAAAQREERLGTGRLLVRSPGLGLGLDW